jgi:hypothetical protein
MWNEILAFPALVGCAWVLRGVVSILFESAEPVMRHLAWSAALLIVAVLGRGVFWDVGRAVFNDDWPQLVAALGGIEINAVFYIPVMFAVWHFGKVLQYLIPDDERHQWPFWKVPFYPYGLCIENLRISQRSRKDEAQ